jgi:SWIM zinc finger
MEFSFAYKGSSAVLNRPDSTRLSFAPDLRREPTFFTGELHKSVPFREAISALHDVVVSDLRFQPKDRTEYLAWAAKQEQLDWMEIAAQQAEVAAQIRRLGDEHAELMRRHNERLSPFQKAKKRFFDYLFHKALDIWRILSDPVVTVHPDEVFFECFSKDESSYGRLGASYEVFRDIGPTSCGTTNIDYSERLYAEFQKIRSYKTTRFEVDPTGFEVQTRGEAELKEVKIDLPDTWVRGFLQVNSAMALPSVSFELHPMDIHNLCFVLRRHKEKKGPRALRYRFAPGRPVEAFLEPWETRVPCPRSIYEGGESGEIRVWGRRRLLVLERLIPVARRVRVHLLGTGLPSFYVVDLGDMSFTLGLSGWTVNDWSRAGNFDLLAPRAEVDEFTKRRVFDALKRQWLDRPEDLAGRLGLDRASVLGALGTWCQAGRAMYDLNKQVYRARELSREPLPMSQLRFANAREESASRLLGGRGVRVTSSQRDASGAWHLQGSVRDERKTLLPTLIVDTDQRIVQAECSCRWHKKNKLFQGPCEHILALRMEAARQRS